MERTVTGFKTDIAEPLTESEFEERRASLRDLLKSQNTGSHLSFFLLNVNQRVISVGIRGRYYGMWLFDANSREEAEVLSEEGLTLEENETDMILAGKEATIREINKQMPQFLMKFYPELVITLDNKKLTIQSQTN